MNGADSEKQWLELENLWKLQRVKKDIPAAILKWVRHQERRMRLVTASEILLWLLSVIYITKTIMAKSLPDTPARLFFAFTVFAMGISFSILNRRGLWGPLEESAQAYIDLALLRLRRKRREVHFCWLYLFIQLGILGVWHFISIEMDATSPVIRNPKESALVVLGLTIFLAAYSYYIYWRTGWEKVSLKNLQEKYLN
ncbi:hypothetical protein [uncultured Microbulbifer sp.]|uniref:hypothetical protein n=1 Tax=uncultured Microbulbifer sp. TaxID=348147 RepID=UPI002625BBDB|nr:hypothetical protein [uncultured Microbulbifer sp.]